MTAARSPPRRTASTLAWATNPATTCPPSTAGSCWPKTLELAGKRRIRTNDHDQRARLSSYPAHRWHRMLPPVAEVDIPRLINGWDSSLEDQAIALLGVDTEQLRAHVRAAIYRELTRPVVDAEVV